VRPRSCASIAIIDRTSIVPGQAGGIFETTSMTAS
jgi:hypothetical protein